MVRASDFSNRLRVWLPGLTYLLSCNIAGQVVHTHVPLLPSSIIWYWPKNGDVLGLGINTRLPFRFYNINTMPSNCSVHRYEIMQGTSLTAI